MMAVSCTGAQGPPAISLLGIRWSVADPLRTRQVAARLAARGVQVAHTPLPRWGIPARPQLAVACHRCQRPVWGSGRLAEPARQGKGQGRSLERAVDQHGQPMAVRLTAHRAPEAARRLLQQASRRPGRPERMPRDGRDAPEAASQICDRTLARACPWQAGAMAPLDTGTRAA